MTDRERTTDLDQLLEAKRQVAVRLVEQLLATCQKYEQPIWLSKYIEVFDCLREGRLQDAIFAECRLKNDSGSEYREPKWVLSKEMAEDVRKAVSLIRTHLLYGDQRDPLIIHWGRVDIESQGTIAQERHRILESFFASIRRDPIDDDPQFAAILAEVEKVTKEALHRHPMKGGLGFCQVYWETKKSILKERYGIEWKTPDELNPTIIFD